MNYKKHECICLECGNKFLSAHAAAETCSPECYKLRKARLVRERYTKRPSRFAEKPCGTCGKVFVPVNVSQKYCCGECAEKAARKRKEENAGTLKTYYHEKMKRKRTSLDDSTEELKRLGFGNDYGKYRIWKDKQKQEEGA